MATDRSDYVLTAQDVCAILRTSSQRLAQLTAAGRLKYRTTHARAKLYSATSVKEFLQKHRASNPELTRRLSTPGETATDRVARGVLRVSSPRGFNPLEPDEVTT